LYLTRLHPYFGKLTENSVVDQHQLAKELDTIKKQGYAISQGEKLEGVVALAVPIIKKDRLVAAIGVYGPEVRLNLELISSYLNKLICAQDEIASWLTSMFEG
jgi:DNA-binding IclR family transcriptional regulator